MADEGKPDEPHDGSDPRPSAQPKASSHDRSEWTVSDERGPLGKADEDEIEVSDRPAPHEPISTGAGDDGIHPAMSRAGSEPPADPDVTTKPVDDPPVAETPYDIPPRAAEPAETSRRSAMWPVAAAIVLGAIVGAGSAYLMYSTVPGAGADARIAALAARVDALEQRPAGGASKAAVADLERKVAALPTAGSGNDNLDKRVAALEGRIDSLKAQGSGDADLAAKIAALESTLAGMRKETSSAQASVADVAGQQRSMASEQKLLADKVMVPALAVVADSLVQQIDGGQPYATQVAALETLGADPAKIAILKQNADKGVASAKTLASRFAPLAGPLSATPAKAPADAGLVDRLKTGMFSMVSVRAVGDTSGSDTPSRVAHIEADLAHDNVADALATWNALPSDARAKGEDWSLLAKAHVEAMTAARGLQHDAIVALGAKKS